VWGAARGAVVADRGALTPKAALRLSARALAMSIPLAAACFLFFPRVTGQFWALKRGDEATSGLSGEMTPGGIGRLAIDYVPAFRVRFEGKPPPLPDLYWRGPVLNNFDGFTWRRTRGTYHPGARLEMVGAPIRYRITLEPSQQRWLFALDTVDPVSRQDASSRFRTALSVPTITSTFSYDAVSYLRARSQGRSQIRPASKPAFCSIIIHALAHWRSIFARTGATRGATRRSTGSATTISSTRSNPASPPSTRSTPPCSTASAASAATLHPRT
jgi:hypothetical protein